MSDDPKVTPISELLAADRAMRVATGRVDRWLEQHRRAAGRTLSEPQLDRLLHEALESIAKVLSADAVSLLLANDESTELVGRATFGLKREVDLTVSIPSGEGVSGPVLATGEPRFVEDLREVDILSDVLRSSDQRSYVGVPLSSGGQTFGVLHATRKRVSRFNERDAELLTRYAEPLAQAIERVRLFQAEREARARADAATREAERATIRVQGLQRITAALASAATVGDICEIIIDQAVPEGAVGDLGERAIWMLRDSRLLLVAGMGRSADFPEIPLEPTLPAAEILRDGTPLFVETKAEMARRWPALAGAPTVSFAGLPLIVDGERLGLMAVGFRSERTLDEGEREYLVAVAEQAAVALSRAIGREDLQAATHMAEVRREQLDFLAQASDRLAASLDLEVTLATVADMAVPRLTDRCALYLVEAGSRITRQVLGPRLTDEEWDLFQRGELSLTSVDGIGAVIRTGTKVYVRDVTDAMVQATARSPEHLALFRRIGFGGLLILPLRARGRSLGALALVNRAGRPMDDATVALAEELVLRASVAIDNAAIYTREAHIAGQLIGSLLPSGLPEVPGLDIAVRYQPAGQGGVGVGGDFYDVVPVGPNACLVVVGDVQGKGVEAAAITGLARTTIKVAARFEPRPAVVLGQLNATLVEYIVEHAQSTEHPWDDARLCTAAVVRLDRGRRGWRATVASAGHPLPMLRRADGQVVGMG
ncbi:MAG: GAF domain-containing protein, partial [Acidimicrobiales bacterium]